MTLMPIRFMGGYKIISANIFNSAKYFSMNIRHDIANRLMNYFFFVIYTIRINDIIKTTWVYTSHR
jgi:hypothetical protein